MRSWQLQEAKAKLSELVQRCVAEGPQEITVHGRRRVVVVDAEAYEQFAATLPEVKRSKTFVGLLQEAQLEDGELDLSRDQDEAICDIKL